MNQLNLGAGTHADVTWTPDGWVTSHQPLNADYVFVKEPRGSRMLPCGPHQLAFCRLASSAQYGLVAAWRGLNDHAYVLRSLVSATPVDMGPTGGNNPVALDGGTMAWQTTDTTRRIFFDGNLITVDPRWKPTGLCTANPLTYIDDVRTSVPGMTNPVRDGDLIVGEHPNGGVLCRLNDGRELVLWPGQDTQTPRCAASLDGDRFAVVTWGDQGIRIATDITPEDFEVVGGAVETPLTGPLRMLKFWWPDAPVQARQASDGRVFTLARGSQYLEWVKGADASQVERYRRGDDDSIHLDMDNTNGFGEATYFTDGLWIAPVMQVGAPANATAPGEILHTTSEIVFLDPVTGKENRRGPAAYRTRLEGAWDNFEGVAGRRVALVLYVRPTGEEERFLALYGKGVFRYLGTDGYRVDFETPVPLDKAVAPSLLVYRPCLPATQPSVKATIESFEPKTGHAPLNVRAVAKVTQGQAREFHWQLQRNLSWTTDAVNPASDTDHTYRGLSVGEWNIRLKTVGVDDSVDVSGPRRIEVT